MNLRLRALCIACASLIAAAATAGVLVVGSDRDNTLYENPIGGLSNGAGDHFFTGLTAQGEIRRGLLRFDLSAIPPESTIESVVLTLNMSRSFAGPSPVALHRAAADWGEGASHAPGQEGGGEAPEPGDATWLHTFFDTDFWTSPGGDFAPTASASTVVDGEGLYSWGSTAAMEADISTWVDDPSQNFGWVLLGDEAPGGPSAEGVATAKRFDTRETGAGGGFGPQLEVTFSPPVPVELQSFAVDD